MTPRGQWAVQENPRPLWPHLILSSESFPRVLSSAQCSFHTRSSWVSGFQLPHVHCQHLLSLALTSHPSFQSEHPNVWQTSSPDTPQALNLSGSKTELDIFIPLVLLSQFMVRLSTQWPKLETQEPPNTSISLTHTLTNHLINTLRIPPSSIPNTRSDNVFAELEPRWKEFQAGSWLWVPCQVSGSCIPEANCIGFYPLRLKVSPSQLLESIGKLTPDAQSNTNYNPSSLSTHLELGVVMK